MATPVRDWKKVVEERRQIFSLVATCISSLFLFLSTFGSPFIPSIFLVSIDFHSELNVQSATLGPLGFCHRHLIEGEKYTCSETSIGYQLNTVPRASFEKLPTIPPIVVKLLVIHIVAFALSLSAVLFYIISVLHYKPRTWWGTKITLALAAFSLGSLIIDISLYSVAPHPPVAMVQLGNGTWFTLIAFIMHVSASCNDFLVQRKQGKFLKLDEEEQYQMSDIVNDVELLRRTLQDVLPQEQLNSAGGSPVNAMVSANTRPTNGTDASSAPTIKTLSSVSTFRIDSSFFFDVPDSATYSPTSARLSSTNRGHTREDGTAALSAPHPLRTVSPAPTSLTSIIRQFPVAAPHFQPHPESDMSCSLSDDSNIVPDSSSSSHAVPLISVVNRHET